MNLAERLRQHLHIDAKNRQSLKEAERLESPLGVSSTMAPVPSGVTSITHQLNRLRQLSEKQTERPETASQRAGPDDNLGGEVKATPSGSFLFFSKEYPTATDMEVENPQRVCALIELLQGKAVRCSSRQIAFLDTETTGLSGGTGTYAFLVGLGRWKDATFSVEQYLMRGFDEEQALLQALQESLSQIEILVSFNGKSFDLPLLQSRFVLNRLTWPLNEAVHLDLLHPSRRLWKLRLGDCNLSNLERHLLGSTRQEDVPGRLIPHLYFNYMRTGRAAGLRAVLEHNRQDIRALADLTVRVSNVLSGETGKEKLLPEDLFSTGKYWQALGQEGLSLEFHEAAVQADLPEDLKVDAMCRLARLFKRRNAHAQAVTLWETILSSSPKFQEEVCQNLAMYYEHKQRDLGAALEWTEYAIGRIENEMSPGPTRQKSLTAWQHRRRRLQRKSAGV